MVVNLKKTGLFEKQINKFRISVAFSSVKHCLFIQFFALTNPILYFCNRQVLDTQHNGFNLSTIFFLCFVGQFFSTFKVLIALRYLGQDFLSVQDVKGFMIIAFFKLLLGQGNPFVVRVGSGNSCNGLGHFH